MPTWASPSIALPTAWPAPSPVCSSGSARGTRARSARGPAAGQRQERAPARLMVDLRARRDVWGKATHQDIPSCMRRKASGCRGTTTEGDTMGSLVVMAVIVLCTGWIVWRRRRRGRVHAAPVTPAGLPGATLALHAFAHGNSCLAAGKFAEAIAAFHQACELEPQHPHVAARLAEVARRQQAASATPPVNATG